MCVCSIIQSWEDVRTTLCQYAWIGVFYDKAGLKFWGTVYGQGE
jgi:hypothetical protein